MMSARYQRGDELLRDSDAAMYRAKEAGRARYQVFDGDMHTTVVEQLRLEAELCHAVERGQLVLHYQPIVAVSDGSLEGFEALVRWAHPERGLIWPSEFIAIAEETGLIRGIGHWVIVEACKQLAAWTAFQPALTMSVNLSPHELAQVELPDNIEHVVRESGIRPASLKLEITESAIMPRVPFAQRTLSRLRDFGVLISLDDFGTGYSCLSYLHEFPVTTLKIDRSFVVRIGQPNERPEIMRAIVSLAHTLGIEVTAEGVETAAHLDRIRLLGCEHAQGYFLSPPLNSEAAEVFLRGARRLTA